LFFTVVATAIAIRFHLLNRDVVISYTVNIHNIKSKRSIGAYFRSVNDRNMNGTKIVTVVY